MTDTEQNSGISDISRFDELPDALLQHILSFLDMKEVLGTTLLAKRWRNLWRSLRTLKFSDLIWENEDGTTRFYDFERFVNQVLVGRDGIKLEKLVLDYSHLGLGEFKKWMNIAVGHHVQEIHLYHFLLPTAFHAQCKTLILQNCSYPSDCFTVFSSRRKIKICAPNLTALELKGYLFKGYIMDNLSALVTAEIEVYITDIYRHDPDIIRSSFRDILIGVRTVKCLILTTHCLQRLPESPDCLEQPSFLFEKLIYLKLTEWCECRYIESGEKLLKNFPKLETLVLERSEPTCIGNKGDWGPLSLGSIFHHLKKIDIQMFGDCENEFKFLEYLLNIAPVLEQVTMKASETISEEKLKGLFEWYKKLKTISRTSSSVKIKLMYGLKDFEA
ncbi:hypothetical protein ACHQM5_025144 [Ranunculus cassubicifolius]